MIFRLSSKYRTPLELEDPVSLETLRKRQAELYERWEHRDQTLGDDYPSIPEFYSGRHVFITGGSGFCGKVIIEKLLHSCPNIGNIYVLMRPGRNGQSASDKLKQMIALPMFDRLRKDHPAALDKMVVVVGDCMRPGLGISAEDRRMLADQVSVVIHSAASVRFTDPIMKAARMNTGSTVALVELAREMKNLKALVHISTAYCNTIHNPTYERTYPTEHSYKDVLKYIELPDAHVLDKLGHKFTGYQPNSYVFTKALSEQVIKEAGKDLPVIIVRPSIVTCALEEPIPGWMDNLNGFAMFWAVVSKGIQRYAYLSRGNDMKFDLAPVDLVGKLTILASWARGTDQPLPCEAGDVQVVNETCGEVKPTTMTMMLEVFDKHLADRKVAYPNVARYPRLVALQNYPLYYVLNLLYHVMYGAIVDALLVAFKQKPQLLDVYRKIENANQALKYFQENEFLFNSDNMWRLIAMVHPRDRETYRMFNRENKVSDWYEISRDQLLGVCKYALREPIRGQEDLDRNARIINMWWWAEVCLYIFIIGLATWAVGIW